MTLVKTTIKRRHLWNLLVVACALAVLSIAPISMVTQASNENLGGGVPILVRNGNLAAPSGSVNPHGFAEYQLYADGNREFECEVEDTTFSTGTQLDCYINGNIVGSAAVEADGRARLKLRTSDGDTVPVTQDGDAVEVRNGSTVVVVGALNGGGPNPSPSPTSSPTGSPTGSPSPSPTASPTGSPSPSPTASPSPTGSPSPSPSPTGSPGEEEIYAALSGSTINGILPRGYAAYEIHSSRTELEVRIRQINLPAGSNFTVMIDGTQVGSMNLESDGESRLRLRSDRGDNVPVITGGESIEIQFQGAAILSGIFNGPSPSPSPSPTGSPSPSPSPSPSQARYFETHPSGAGMDPPVSTNARGEVEVTLNADETMAKVEGEFHDLSSAQTTARIEVDLGDLTLVHDFGAIGGTNGNFATATIPVSAAMVDQLRAGLWIATIASQNNPGGEIRGTLIGHSDSADFDGDGNNDLAVFRPTTGTWYTMNSQGFSSIEMGTAADVPVSADYDGDGKTDTAIFKNVNGSGIWEIRHSSDGGTTETQFGFASDKPVRGDFDGDGLNDLAVFRPSNGVWYVRKSNNTGFLIVQFGIAEDIPVAGDFDGDGKADVAVFRPSTGVWYGINSSNGSVSIVKWGQDGDIPVRGDFDGDGRNDLAVYRPSTGVWYIYRSSNGTFHIQKFGIAEDIPVAGLYDGDNLADIAVFRPSTGIWYIFNSADATVSVEHFGLNGDIPTITQ